MPEGHWRGNPRRGGSNRPYRPQGPHYPDDDVDMSEGKERNRWQGMYKTRGGRRRMQDTRNPRNNPNTSTSNMGWHKIIIRDGCMYDKNEVLDNLKEYVEEPFVPILYEVEGNSLVFYLEDNGAAAKAITNVNRRVTMRNGSRLIICNNRSPPPNRPLSVQQQEKVMHIMSERYCLELKRLDLKNFHNAPSLIKEQIFFPLYRTPNMKIIVDIIIQNIPQVEEIDLSCNKIHTLEEIERIIPVCTNLKRLNLEKNKLMNVDCLAKLQGLAIMELSLEGNPLCDKFTDTETYFSSVRKHIPKVMYLDGRELPKAIGFEVEEEVSKLPQAHPSFFVIDGVKDIVLKFIQQYYEIYDTDNRRPLEAAYTENASFSLTCVFPDAGPVARYSGAYVAENRNLKKVQASDKRQKLLIQGRSSIINTISNFPMTMHDPGSFTVDVPVADPKLMNVTLSGVFKQVVDRAPPVRFFTRSFTIVPEGSGYCICNEQLYLTFATSEQIKRSFKSSTPTMQVQQPVGVEASIVSAEANLPMQGETLQPVQQVMIAKFSEISGMLPQYSQLCLEQNGWDFDKAGKRFLQLKNGNQIPPEYFPQSS